LTPSFWGEGEGGSTNSQILGGKRGKIKAVTSPLRCVQKKKEKKEKGGGGKGRPRGALQCPCARCCNHTGGKRGREGGKGGMLYMESRSIFNF